MRQPVHTLRTVLFALAVAASLGFGVAQASASPSTTPARAAAACDEGMCDYWCGGLGKCRGELCDCY